MPVKYCLMACLSIAQVGLHLKFPKMPILNALIISALQFSKLGIVNKYVVF